MSSAPIACNSRPRRNSAAASGVISGLRAFAILRFTGISCPPVAAERWRADPGRNRWLNVKIKLPNDPHGRQAAVALKRHFRPQARYAVAVQMGHAVRGKRLSGGLSGVQSLATEP